MIEVVFVVHKQEKINGMPNVVSKNGKVYIPITSEEFDSERNRFHVHSLIAKAIREKCPGWAVDGYAPFRG